MGPSRYNGTAVDSIVTPEFIADATMLSPSQVLATRHPRSKHLPELGFGVVLESVESGMETSLRAGPFG
jgi:hypothetical protein